ncbi:MAG: T9SS type A sorting domain-containing protein [Flavobacteriia bacterium]
MKNVTFIIIALLNHGAWSQVDNTMYGLYQILNPPSFQLASIDPLTGQIAPIGSAVLSNTVNATGSALNPYNHTYSYQDEDSWLTLDLQTGAIVSDVAVTLPNTSGNFNNFRFNTADSLMYGLYSQIVYDPLTGLANGDMRLATCDLSSGAVDIISSNSIAESYTMSGSTINPYLMVYYFESEGKFMGLDLYNGQIYSQPLINLPGGGNSFDNFAYSCTDTSVYGLIMQNGVKSLGKIDPNTGTVTALPTILNFDNYVMNSGGAIDPVNLIYYFQTIDNTGQLKLVGLSLLDGSAVSQSSISGNGDYFILYRIQNDCFEAEPTRLNPLGTISEFNDLQFQIHPNPTTCEVTVNVDEHLIGTTYVMNDELGRNVLTGTFSSTSQKIDLSSYSSGVYFLTAANQSGVQKIVKQ